MSWTIEKKQEAMAMWNRGIRTRDIAEALGPGFTRNMIIGLAHRLKMGTHDQSTHQVRLKDKPAREPKEIEKPHKPKQKPPLGPAPDPLCDQQTMPRLYALRQPSRVIKTPEPPPINAITIIELERYHCRAVVDGRRDNLPLYCGGQRLEGSSYCAAHFDKYFGGRLR